MGKIAGWTSICIYLIETTLVKLAKNLLLFLILWKVKKALEYVDICYILKVLYEGCDTTRDNEHCMIN